MEGVLLPRLESIQDAKIVVSFCDKQFFSNGMVDLLLMSKSIEAEMFRVYINASRMLREQVKKKV